MESKVVVSRTAFLRMRASALTGGHHVFLRFDCGIHFEELHVVVGLVVFHIERSGDRDPERAGVVVDDKSDNPRGVVCFARAVILHFDLEFACFGRGA